MNNFTYENQGTNTYLVYKVEADDVLDNMSLGMLTNNKIPGLSGTLFTQINDDMFVKYNISSLISANQLFYGTVNRRRLLSVFKGVADTMLALDDYMIDVNLVLLNLDYIFVDPSTYAVSMICLPIANRETVTMYDFIKNIMFSTQFEQSENCDYVTRIINYLNSTPTFSLSSFKQFIDSLVDNSAPTPAVNIPVRATPITTAHPVVNNTPSKVETPVAKPIEQPVKSVVPPVVKNEPVVINSPENNASAPQAKNMSLFYLMQHYNKENAAAYKAQKEAKKQAGKKAAAPAKTKSAKTVGNTDMGFAIPGQEIPVAPATPVQTPQNVPLQNKPQPQPVAATPAANPTPVRQQAPSSTYIHQVPTFDDFDDDEGTVVIGVNQQERQLSPHLIRRKTGERIQINKPVFKIGRNSELNDYNIQGNNFIGHRHCHIVTRDTDFYIIDDNTKNHTYVDGQMITGSIEVQISDGCIIRLADEDFEFKLY